MSPDDGSVVDFVETGDILDQHLAGGERARTAYVTLSGSGRLGRAGGRGRPGTTAHSA